MWDPGSAVTDMIPDASQIGSNIQSFLGNPRVNSALLSTGLALMQPPSFGDTPASQIARAIGAGAQSVQQQEAQDQQERKLRVAEQEGASKEELRTAQAGAAAERAHAAQSAAEAAGTRANAAADRVAYQRSTDEANRNLRALGTQIKLSNAYQTSIAKIRQQNANNRLLGQPEVPEPSFQDWVAQNPNLKAYFDQTGPVSGGGGVTPPDMGAVQAPPADPAARQEGVPYRSASGQTVYWDSKVGKFYTKD